MGNSNSVVPFSEISSSSGNNGSKTVKNIEVNNLANIRTKISTFKNKILKELQTFTDSKLTIKYHHTFCGDNPTVKYARTPPTKNDELKNLYIIERHFWKNDAKASYMSVHEEYRASLDEEIETKDFKTKDFGYYSYYIVDLKEKEKEKTYSIDNITDIFDDFYCLKYYEDLGYSKKFINPLYSLIKKKDVINYDFLDFIKQRKIEYFVLKKKLDDVISKKKDGTKKVMKLKNSGNRNMKRSQRKPKK